MGAFSIQVITALTEAITGGSGGSQQEPVGKYRSASELTRFFGGANVEFNLGYGSRVPTVHDTLVSLNRQTNGLQALTTVIEQVADPREYLQLPGKSEAVVAYLNGHLRFDGYELRVHGNRYRLVKSDTGMQATAALQEHTQRLDLQTVRRDFDRAVTQADDDPEDAITAACSTLESVCKCLLDEMGQPYPSKMDVAGLMKDIQKHLNLAPGRTDLPADIENDIRMVLQGISTAAQGIGALRTHGGDAHGRGKQQTSRLDGRIARLAIHAASTISVFLIETWQVRCRKPA